MTRFEVGKSGVTASAIIQGCMRMHELTEAQAAQALQAAVDSGITMFDHADIYGAGKSEAAFAQAMKNTGIRREDILLQSKCGIRPEEPLYDFSKAHILKSVDGILSRLKTDYLDFLLLHRPDTLVEPEEVAEAFNELEASGKVRHFGVSNQNPFQVELLKRYVKQPLVANQLQFSPVHTLMVDCGINVNNHTDHARLYDGMVLDYCRLNDITIQAWSPYQYGMIKGVFLENLEFADVNKEIRRIADEKGVSDTTIVAAWILRHPAKMQVIAGSMNPGRIAEIAAGAEVALSREEWYSIYRAAGNPIP